MESMLGFFKKKFLDDKPQLKSDDVSSISSDSNAHNDPTFIFNPQRMEVGGMPVESGT
jgi:hypothetical protein